MLETEPRDLLLDDDNDLVIVDGDLAFSRGIQGVVQEGRIGIQMFQEEWFLDLDTGIPYWQEILGQKPNLALTAAKLYMLRRLRRIEDVYDIPVLSADFDPVTRDMRIRWRARTAFGDTPIDTIAIAIEGTHA